MARGLLVTGTDTGVGKSAVAAALIRWARQAGLQVGGMKPVESGCSQRDGSLFPADAHLLQQAAGGTDPLERVCPYRLQAPLAPGIAAAQEGVAVDLQEITKVHQSLLQAHPDGIIVEGAGGLLVPVDPAFATVADLALLLELPVIVVARPGLGTINHSALTVEALAARGIECRGLILNGVLPGEEAAAQSNAQAIERLVGAEVLATLPWLEAEGELARAEALAAALAGRKLDPKRLLA